MDYKLTRSKRKTVAIYIRNGGVDVRAPLKTPQLDIDTFVASKEIHTASCRHSERNGAEEAIL